MICGNQRNNIQLDLMDRHWNTKKLLQNTREQKMWLDLNKNGQIDKMQFRKLTTTATNTGKIALVVILDRKDQKLSKTELPGLQAPPGICSTEDVTSKAPDVIPWGVVHLLGSMSAPQ